MNDDIIFEIFTWLTPEQGINYAITCKQMYYVWNMEALWRRKLSEIIEIKPLLNFLGDNRLTYNKYNWLVTGIGLESFYSNIDNPSPNLPLMVHNAVNDYFSDKLTSLNFFKCNLKSIPSFIGNISTLRFLSLDGNYLQAIPRSFRKLTNLEFLDIQHNNLQYISHTFGYMTNLKILKLNNNSLSTLPSVINWLTNLEELDLQYNRIRYLWDGWIKLRNLKTLKLNNNFLTKLPTELTCMDKLKILHIYSNPLSQIPHAFMKFQCDIFVNDIFFQKNINVKNILDYFLYHR